MKGIQKIKWSGKGKIDVSKSKPNVTLAVLPKNDIGFVVDKWLNGTTEEDKKKNVTWILQDKNRKEIRRIQKSPKEEYTLNIPNALCGPYTYYLEASFSGIIDRKNKTGLWITGTCTPRVINSKWSTTVDGADVRKKIQFKYGQLIYLSLETEGLNGSTSLTVEVYKVIEGSYITGREKDKLVATFNNVAVIDGEVNLKMGNTASWFVHAKKDEEQFYVKVKTNWGSYVSDGKSDIHARFLRMKKEQVSKAVEPSTNNTPLKVGETTKNFFTPISCKYKKIIISDKDSNSDKFNTIIYDELKTDETNKYSTIASSDEGKTTIDLSFEDLKNDKCYTKPLHNKQIEIYLNDVQQNTKVISGEKFNLPIKAYSNKTLLRAKPELFFIMPDPINKYKIIAKTCAQKNNPIYIDVYPKVEREVAFVLSLFKTFNAEINQKFSNQEKLTDYNKKQSMQLIRNELEILYQTKGGLGYGLSAKVKVDNVESSIELGTTKNQIKKLIGFYNTVQEVLSVFDGKGREEQSIAYSSKKLPKVTFDIEPPNVALALRITNKKIDKTYEIVRQLTGALALKPITKIKIGVDLLSLLQYMGIGGKIANWIKEELEEYYKFTIYIIFEVFLEAKSELSLTYNNVEGFAPGPRKIQIEAGIGIKGGVKSTEFVSVFVPESDGKLQEVKVEKFKGEASGISSILYTYEIKSDKKGQFNQHKMEFTGVKATIVVYAIRKGMKYNETVRKDFTIIERPDKLWYESDKEYTL